MTTDLTRQDTAEARTLAPQALADYLRERLEDKVVDAKVAYSQLTLTVAPEALPAAAQLCKEDPNLAFDFFDFMSGVDLAEEGFAVVTHLYSVRHRHHINLRAVAPGGRDVPTLPTLCGVYRGANWHEREAYDMFGIEFEGHPGLLPRILTVENFEGWPLRKEFLLSTREAKPWPGLKEPKAVEDEGGDGEAATSGPSAGERAVAQRPPGGGDPGEKAAAAKAKAERAKQKAAAMRAKKAQERAAEQQAAAAGQHPGAQRPAETTAKGEEAVTPDKPPEARQPEAAGRDEQADAARETRGGDTEDTAAAAAAVAEGDAAAQTPEGAAEVAQTDVAKDAAAGAPSGDTYKGAPSDAPGHDQPVRDADEESRVAEGAKATASGAPGVEAEGRHGGAEVQAGDRPAAETPGMTSGTQRDEAARSAQETPAPLPPEGPGQETPRALREGGVESQPLAETLGNTAEVGSTEAETVRAADTPPRRHRTGTDADDRLAERDEDSDRKDRE